MGGIERGIPGAATSRLTLQNHSLDTGAKEDRSEHLERRCKFGDVEHSQERNKVPSRCDL